jgi:hypothetical protein
MGRSMYREIEIRSLGRSALAALALAGACGEDGAAPERDASQNAAMTNRPDAGDGEQPHDAASAGAADAGAGGGSGPPLDEERIAQAALAFCEITFGCDPEMSATYLESAQACPAIVEGFVRDGANLDGAACGLAQLDSYACYAGVGCDEQFTACELEGDRELEACPLSLGGI